jgi:hypothetical protein
VALQSNSQSIVPAGTTPVPITPTASDTFPESAFGQQGLALRVITTGTATNAATLDPGSTPQGNPGTVTAVACPATGSRMVLVPRSAINPATAVATVTFSGALTGVTYEMYRI